jgi:RNA polymerase sigma-70 factor, ECF subfamily
MILSNEDFILLKNKDSGVITKIFRELKDDIYKFIYYRTGGRHEEADEIFSDSTEALLKYLPKIKYNKNLKNLWIKISAGKISDYYKRAKKHKKTVDNIKDDIIISQQDNPGSGFDMNEAFALYNTALQSINKKYRKIIIFRYKENRSLDEICRLMNSSKKSVKNTLFRAKSALSKQMNYYKRKI